MPQDKITNWYEKIGTQNSRNFKLDKNFHKHKIKPTSHILAIGGTGSGKTLSLIEWLSRKNDSFYKIIIFSGSTTDEPLYGALKEAIPEIELYNDINDLPSLSEFDDDEKHLEKLAIFDDFINLKKPEMKKIQEYLTAGRKFGFSTWSMAQNYISVPKTITRNINYFIIFRLNDNISINNIIRNHNIENSPEEVKQAYIEATSEPRNFLLIDLKDNNLRHNFLDIL